MPRYYIDSDTAYKLHALDAIQKEVHRMRFNYPIEAVEQEVFMKVLHALRVIQNIYTEE